MLVKETERERETERGKQMLRMTHNSYALWVHDVRLTTESGEKVVYTGFMDNFVLSLSLVLSLVLVVAFMFMLLPPLQAQRPLHQNHCTCIRTHLTHIVCLRQRDFSII